MPPRSRKRRSSKPRVANDQYYAAQLQGFRDAIYDQSADISRANVNETAFFAAFEGKVAEQDSMTETRAYKAGYAFGRRFVLAYRHYGEAEFPELEATLMGQASGLGGIDFGAALDVAAVASPAAQGADAVMDIAALF